MGKKDFNNCRDDDGYYDDYMDRYNNDYIVVEDCLYDDTTVCFLNDDE